MIVGVGIDVCEVSRMENLLNKENVLKKIFSADELAYIRLKCVQRNNTMAGLFAAKEAFVKAMGTGFKSTLLYEICIMHTDMGAPYYMLTGSAKSSLDEGITLHLSITHDKGIAAAVCIMER